jgi:hypothetical protein
MSNVDPTMSPGDRLRQMVRTKTERKPVTFAMPTRTGFSIVCRTNVSLAEVKSCAERAGSDQEEAGVEEQIVAAAMLIADVCTHITCDGERWEVDGGKVVTFASKAMFEATQTDNATDAVRVFFDSDADVLAASQHIFERSGLNGSIRPS